MDWENTYREDIPIQMVSATGQRILIRHKDDGELLEISVVCWAFVHTKIRECGTYKVLHERKEDIIPYVLTDHSGVISIYDYLCDNQEIVGYLNSGESVDVLKERIDDCKKREEELANKK